MSAAPLTIDTAEQAFWDDACLAATLFAKMASVERSGAMPSVLARAKAGPVLDAWLEMVTMLAGGKRLRRVPQGIDAAHLIGGLDITATVDASRSVFSPGLLQQAHGEIVLLPQAETMDAGAVSIINGALDSGVVRVERDGMSRVDDARFALVAVDQSEDDEDGVPASLAERCMFHVDLTQVSIRSLKPLPRLSLVKPDHSALCGDDELQALCQMALAFGLFSMRPVHHALSVACCHAGWQGRDVVGEEDIAVAMRLSYIQRATRLPMPPEPEQEPAPPEPEANNEPDESDASHADGPLEDSVTDAIDTMLPEGLLEQLMRPVLLRQSAMAGRRGAKKDNFKRGRPLASRAGKPGGFKRLDLIATLRKAAPWQKLRRQQVEQRRGRARTLHVRSSDFQIRRFRQSAETTTIFLVDASGSTALNRLGEAKGAVELLLSESYSRRDSVALVSFRGTGAEVLLAPTRALARAKKALSALPGGGGTPLASGLQTALALALDQMRKGHQTSVVVLTDGSANVGLDGKGGRAKAAQDAQDVAEGFRSAGVSSIVIDVGRKPGRNSTAIADAMGAALIAMPFANAEALSSVVKANSV
ncbi:magnesium chelatase subunit D [Pseudahrensia aquimaris]|uniref:Magnesium chelatase subunit D n=1 Tax=Pseudahrensia aquimaris TaxID=744461 RepID=A0ABW3FIL3_9HYPH